jgi:hypothetical protein
LRCRNNSDSSRRLGVGVAPASDDLACAEIANKNGMSRTAAALGFIGGS